MTQYTLGFAFDEAAKRVVLIQKARPSWQRGLLNGVGGHVEKGESYHECMSREFREETGVDIYSSNWKMFARLFSPKFEMHVFATFTNEISYVKSLTDEPVGIYSVDDLMGLPTIGNVPWLIHAARDVRDLPLDKSYVVEAAYNG